MQGGAVGEEETTSRDEEATGEASGWEGEEGEEAGEVAEGCDRKNGAAAGCWLGD